MLDANRGWTFDQIAEALNRKHGERWIIHPNDDFVYDQRMQDEHLHIPALNQRLALSDIRE